MTDTMEPLAIKTPTFEQARDAFRGVWAEHRYADDCLMWMLDALHAELADEREIVRGQAEIFGELRTQIRGCAETVSSLARGMADDFDTLSRTVEVGTQQPTMRMRLQHSHTLKEGWRLSETTVEWSGAGEPDEAAIEKALLTAYHLGQREANLRNAPQPATTDEGDPS